jgi:hypothetical protein
MKRKKIKEDDSENESESNRHNQSYLNTMSLRSKKVKRV